MGAIDRVSNRDEPEDLDPSTAERTDQVARAGREVPPKPVDGDTEQARRIARVMARVLRDDDWDTDHLTDDDRRRYLDGDPRQAIPEQEGLRDAAANPAKYRAEDQMRRFKEQLREALEDANQIPGNETHQTLFHAASFGDGTAERFLRRLWRDLYPDEPVPGGDDEFRSDLIAVIRGEKRLSWSIVLPYTEYYDDTGMSDAEFARMIWQKKFPNEAIPGDEQP